MQIAKDAHVDEGLSHPEASPLTGLVPRMRCPEVWAQLELSAFTCLHTWLEFLQHGCLRGAGVLAGGVGSKSDYLGK